jgi:polysaccharide export outer membrane protein
MKKDPYTIVMPGFIRILFCSSLIGVFCASSFFGQDSDPTATPANIIITDNYTIGAGDVIDVVVNKNDALTRTGVRVSERGTIQLPMFDEDVPAACMTERELADQIKEKYKKYLIEPYINVAVREFISNPVSLIGAVQSPGRFQVQRPTRLLELITLVNGPSAAAGNTIEIIRTLNRPYCSDGKLIPRSEISEEIVTLSLSDAMKGIESANPFVRGGDIIRVVEAEPMNAYLQGAVKASMTIDLKEPVTLSQAVAMAGGLAPGANAEKILIRRQIPDSINRSDLIVSLKAINQGKQDDILLEPNDIISVPGPSGFRKVLKRVTDTLIPSLIRIPY